MFCVATRISDAAARRADVPSYIQQRYVSGVPKQVGTSGKAAAGGALVTRGRQAGKCEQQESMDGVKVLKPYPQYSRPPKWWVRLPSEVWSKKGGGWDGAGGRDARVG